MTSVDDELTAIIEGRVGKTVCGGKYRIERVLGIGGMAAVYAGMHRNGRPVAMKILHPAYSRRADVRKRFLREGQAANAVQHRGVVAVIDDDVTEDGAAFVVMERLEGQTLEQLWHQTGRRFPIRAVLAIGRELCEILAVAHRAGIIHRDIKPENLFLTNDGELKVLDFGLAQLQDTARPTVTQTGMVFGTPAFMPPEQARGQTSKIDARTDLWAVGATMFTLLSGELVHRGESAQHFVVLAATEPARSLVGPMPNAHPALIALVDRALNHEKERRWQSAESMREAIVSLSEMLLGDPETRLMTPVALMEATAQQRAKARLDLPKLQPSSVFDDSTPRAPKLNPIAALMDQTHDDNRVEDETLTDSTRARAALHRVDDSSDSVEERTRIGLPDFAVVRDGPDTETNVRRTPRSDIDELPRVGGSSDASEDGTYSAEPQTELRRQPPSSSHGPIDRTALLRTSDFGPASAPHPPVRPSAPMPMPMPQSVPTSARNQVPRAKSISYLPLLLAVIVLGLSPLGYFAVRGCGGTATEPAASASVVVPSLPSAARAVP